MSRPTYKRAERVADQIRMEVADILAKKSKDPRLSLVTVTDVKVSNDLRTARIYVSTLEQGPQAQEVFQGIEKAKGFIRSELGHRIVLRYTPELSFWPDSSGPRAERVWKILDELSPSQDADNPNSESLPPAGPSEG